MNVYAGIGSRKISTANFIILKTIARQLHFQEWWARTGGAEGADTAIALGARSRCITYKPWANYKPRDRRYPNAGRFVYSLEQKHFLVAATFHPAWTNCSQGARRMHARNSQIILGEHLDSPVKFVLCYSPGGGGTQVGVDIAKSYDIPIFNIYTHPNLKVGDILKEL